MAKKEWVVTGDITFAFVMSVMAETEEEAEEMVASMNPDKFDICKEEPLVDIQEVQRGNDP